MAEQPKPPADPRLPPTAEQGDGRGASHAAFDAWLRDALRQRFGGVANEPIPDELRRLAAGEARPAEERAGGSCHQCDAPDAQRDATNRNKPL
jgi:hypothetical protein